LSNKIEPEEPDSTQAGLSSDVGKAMRTPPVEGQVTDAQYQCKICGQVFTNQTELDEHTKSHRNVQKRIEEEGTAGVA
jgi:hypothetical protein